MNPQSEIRKTPMHLVPQDNYMSPLLSGDCVTIRHPGQVPQRGTRAGIQTTAPRGEPETK
jgi:hypothetical protein